MRRKSILNLPGRKSRLLRRRRRGIRSALLPPLLQLICRPISYVLGRSVINIYCFFICNIRVCPPRVLNLFTLMAVEMHKSFSQQSLLPTRARQHIHLFGRSPRLQKYSAFLQLLLTLNVVAGGVRCSTWRAKTLS